MKHINALSQPKAIPGKAESLLAKAQMIENAAGAVDVLSSIVGIIQKD